LGHHRSSIAGIRNPFSPPASRLLLPELPGKTQLTHNLIAAGSQSQFENPKQYSGYRWQWIDILPLFHGNRRPLMHIL